MGLVHLIFQSVYAKYNQGQKDLFVYCNGILYWTIERNCIQTNNILGAALQQHLGSQTIITADILLLHTAGQDKFSIVGSANLHAALCSANTCVKARELGIWDLDLSVHYSSETAGFNQRNFII